MTRKDIEAAIKTGVPKEQILEMLFGSLKYRYADEILEEYADFLESQQAAEARKRREIFKERIAKYKKDNNAKAHNLTQAELQNKHEKDKNYEKLALYRLDSLYFEKLPGSELERHKTWKRNLEANVCKPYEAAPIKKEDQVAKDIENLLKHNGYTKAELIKILPLVVENLKN